MVGFILTCFISSSFAQQHHEICNLQIKKAASQEVLGKNVGIYVEVVNNSSAALDALEFDVNYFDGFDNKMGSRNFKWQSGNFIKPIQPQKLLHIAKGNWVKGANKIQVVMIKAHFANGSECRK